MSCVNYYVDDSLYGFYLFLIGLLIGLIIILISWRVVCFKFTNNKVSDINSFVKYNKTNRKLLLKQLNTVNINEESTDEKIFIYYNHFNKWKNLYGNYMNVTDHIDLSNLFRLNMSLIQEDIMRFDDLEFHYRNDRITGHKNICKQLVNMFLKEKLISAEEHKQYISSIEKKYKSQVDHFNNECDAFLTELKANAPKDTSDSEMQVIIAEKLPQKADLLMNNIIADQGTDLRELILKVQVSKKMSNDDVSAILSMYLKSKRDMDKFLNENQEQLRERIARRLENLRLNFNGGIIENNVTEIENEEREKNILNNIQGTLPDLSESDKNKLMEEYRKNIDRIKSQYEADFLAQRQALSAKIESSRKKELEKLFNSYEKDTIKNEENSEKISLDQSKQSNIKYQQTKTMIDEEVNSTIEKWDQKEMKEIKSLKDNYSQSMDDEISALEFKLLDQLYQSHGVDNYEINGILRQHQQNNNNIKSQMNEEKRRQMQKMNNMMNERLLSKEDDLAIGISNQNEQESKQRQILNKAMNDQMELPLSLKNKIIEDSQSNEFNIRNQLMALKVRQQKQLELALAKKMCANIDSQKPIKNSGTIRQVDLYEEEIKKSEIDKERILLELRDKLTMETKEMLSHYEDEICNIMASYQVNHAKELRKKKNTQTLYDNLCKVLSRPALEQNPLAAEQVIDQYTNDKNNLENIKNNSEQEQKKQMEMKLLEKTTKIKNQKQSELKRRYTDQLQALKDDGVNEAALTIANDLMIEKMDEETENAIQIERIKEGTAFEKSKDEYEKNIENELLNKKKDIISRLVLIAEVTPSQISDMIDGINPNIDEDTKKSIINEIKRKTNENAKEKSFFQFQKPNTDQKYSNDGLDIPDTNVDPMKTKKKKKRMKVREENAENENIDSDH